MPNKKILLIEDNEEMRENTAEILQLSQYKVFTAKNGKEGVALAEKELPDLIICDIIMPVMDGYSVLENLSKNNVTAHIPFIFLTAKVDRADFRKGMEMGADDYLTKPFDETELINAIEIRLRKSEVLKSDFSRSLDGLNSFFKEIKGIDLLKQLSEEGEIRVYKKKEEIYKENSYPKGIYYLSKGKIKTHKLNDFGKELITGLYKEGDFFGYIPLFDEGRYSDSATAMEDSELCLIPKNEFYGLVYSNAQVSKKFIQILSNNLREKEEQLVKLAYNSVRKKVADALVTLYDRYKNENDNNLFSISIPREDLANLAGIATETTIRTLSDLKEEKLIEVNASKIVILNYDKLKNMHN
jgi:cAMP-binding proteins - catabolite gene activator and regulatory subunit of cAMP-dependent protein kinases